MKRIKIFLASSIKEFADERIELKDFIRRLSDVLLDSDIRLQLFICEYADNEMVVEGMQEKYLKEIDDSNIFLLLAGDKLGKYTLLEYKYALKIQEEKSLKILIAFRHSDTADETVKSFAQKIATENSSQITFKTFSEIKTELTEVIAGELSNMVEIRILDEGVIINGKKAAIL